MTNVFRKAFNFALIIGILLPAIFIIFAIQYSAITFPFWDHVELIRFINKYADGTLTFFDLVSPHNQTRPLTYRSIYIVNAILTNWDIRSEYIFVYASLLANWVIHILFLWRILDRKIDTHFLVSSLIVSIILFSPVGHNNHWWSMMLQLDLTNVLIALALFAVALRPQAWSAHAVAAVSAWLAAYTLTNGIFAFIVIIVALKLTDRPFYSPKISRFLAFWIVNTIVLSILYFPGIPVSEGIPHPKLIDLIHFTLAYLGNPIGSLLWYPFAKQFDVPASTTLNTTLGVGLVVAALVSARMAWDGLRQRRADALVLFLFVGLAVISALATAWGRAAFDAAGVSNANSSRYSIFAAYLPLGLLLYHTARFRTDAHPGAHPVDGPRRGFALGALAVFVAASAVSYARAVPIYKDSRELNRLLSEAYALDNFGSEYNWVIYPVPAMVLKTKMDLLLRGLGPYRYSHGESVHLTTPTTETLRAAPGRTVTQSFALDTTGLQALRIATSAGAPLPDGQALDWTLLARTDGGREEIGKGRIVVQNGLPVIVPLKRMPSCRPYASQTPAACRSALELVLRTDMPEGAMKGEIPFALHQSPDAAAMPAATLDGTALPSGAVLGIDAIYARSRT